MGESNNIIRRFSCHTCGNKIDCPSGEPHSSVLAGWFAIAHWTEGNVVHYTFCSIKCLKSWADKEMPEVPQVFKEAFNDEKNKG